MLNNTKLYNITLYNSILDYTHTIHTLINTIKYRLATINFILYENTKTTSHNETYVYLTIDNYADVVLYYNTLEHIR
jgi:hypothetical protein